MSGPTNGRTGPDAPALADLQARVSDLEECLADLCERMASYVEGRERSRQAPTVEGAMGLLADLVEVIRRHPLGS